MEFRKIEYMKRKNINLDNVKFISEQAQNTLDKAYPEDELVLRLQLDEINRLSIEFAAKLTIENIQEACKVNQDVSLGLGEQDG